MGRRRKFNFDRIARAHSTAAQNNTHDACLAHNAIWLGFHAVLEQARLKRLDLMAGISQACELDNRFRP